MSFAQLVPSNRDTIQTMRRELFIDLPSLVDSLVTNSSPLVSLLSCLWLWFAGTFFFDIVHYLLHQCSKSRYRILRLTGHLHQVHHFYFNRRLEFNDKYHWQNLCVEFPLELACQIVGTWLGWIFAYALGLIGPERLSKELFSLVLAVEVVRVFVVASLSGRDSNHKTYRTVPKDHNWFLVGPEYHALHHVDPEAYIGSAFRVFDWLLGTGYSLRSRRITLTGASGAFGQAMKKELLSESVRCIQELKFGVDWTYDDYTPTIPILANTDVLILAHGSKQRDELKANCDSAIAVIELFKQHRKPRSGNEKLLPKVWYVGSEAELHPSWGITRLQSYSRSKRSFLPYARTLYDDPSVIYRHIVPSAFSSPMGPAIVSAEWAARISMWWIRRGARYVPVTYTGLAYVNYFKFMYRVQKIV